MYNDNIESKQKGFKKEYSKYRELESKVLDTIDELKEEIKSLKSANELLKNYVGELETEVEVMARDKEKWNRDYKYTRGIIKDVTKENLDKV
eukprot:CAMPEP_0170534512 /NCGR_PEP_ID=MMETSP0209-20121228/92151_1 /TAXON_ID=665100 ORGANISM="Litonotus pictus, Strain P1" /NCGR_SAMPLE_ID=MMETSP0209 /ASSEMBLY_ACC=CAM_ASM_000301 /LENGTH=91 /DNA_ID=CAMNT_0010834023 /DNA_START=48 /DNA_END=319 /DNA_ORIENTATION=-